MPETATRRSLAKIKDEVTYYPHQLEGVRTMARRGSFLLADEMGLGKSLQALTVAAIDFERGFTHKALIVCPASLKWNWAAEIERFTNFSYVVLDGTPKERDVQLNEFGRYGEGADILIVNYEQLKPHLPRINAMSFGVAIYDEAHAIKNPKAARTKAALAVRADRHFLLTGSPILNQVNDLWSILHRIDAVMFPNYWSFVNRYAVFGGYKDKQIVGVKNQAELSEKLRSVMIRREKKDVLDLPDKQVINITVDLHPEQRKLYQQAQEELRIDLPNDPNPMELENALTKFLRLKQIAGTTACIPGHPDHSFKLDQAEEMADEIVQGGERVVIFTQFREVLARMGTRLDKRGIPVWMLHGDVPPSQRASTVEDWATNSQPGAIVCMLQVAGVGLNMTAASKAIRLDKLFAPKLNEQAEDRLHRIGASSTQPVQVFDLICRNTIESRVEAILRKKQKLFGELVVESEWRKALYEALAVEDLGEAA